MTNNDVLRSIRYALDIKDEAMIDIFAEMDYTVDQPTVSGLLKKDDSAPGFIECTNKILTHFLDGLIIKRRGRKEPKPGQKKPPVQELTNNLILKKLRIALELQEDDLLNVFELVNISPSPHELSALFRRQGHKNYKECGNQLLRNFLKGLVTYYRDN